MSPFVEPLIPLFQTSGDISSSFIGRVSSLMNVLHICVTPSLRFTSGVTPADLLVASIAAKPFSSIHLLADIGGAQN